MHRLAQIVSRGILTVLRALPGLGLRKREAIKRLLVVNSLFDADKIVRNFTSMNHAFLSVDLPKGNGASSSFEKGETISLPKGAEQWVKDRDWAIANNIHGLAGYPLARQNKVLGVMATFSTQPFVPEFLANVITDD